ncbi:MAG: hypothetical protein IKS10_01695 [Lachnospiraceae bacterium]|nr:hypothetical protein [Lachnospiraceae bacterium]
MNKKLSLSPTLLSLLGVTALYLGGWEAGILFFIAILVFETADSVKINLMQYVIVRAMILIVFNAISYCGDVLGWIFSFFDNARDLSKWNIFDYPAKYGWSGFLNLVIFIWFFTAILGKKVVKVPTIHGMVVRNMDFSANAAAQQPTDVQ